MEVASVRGVFHGTQLIWNKKTFSNPSGSGDLIFTYNSIMASSGANESGHFSFGTGNGSENNTRDNCIISVQGTEIGASQSIGRFNKATGKNMGGFASDSNSFVVYSTIVKETTKKHTGTSGGFKDYRYTTKTGGALSAVTIWKIPSDDLSTGGGSGDSDGVNTNPET